MQAMARDRFIHWLGMLCGLMGFVTGQEEPHLPESSAFMQQFPLNIQILEPSGIVVWTKDSPLIDMFGVELYVGRKNGSHHELIWDRQLLVNTSVVVDGKFIIQDNSMPVEKGETIRYRFSVLHKHTLRHKNFHRIIVTDHMFHRPANNDCYSQCLLGERKEVLQAAIQAKELLERKIIECIGWQASNHLLFPLQNAVKLVTDPLLYVEYRLLQVQSLRPFLRDVVSVHLAHNGVGFTMNTVLAKFKLLELAAGHLDIVDFDTLTQAD